MPGSLKASIRISILDGFSAPLRAMAGALSGVGAKFRNVRTVGDLSSPIGKSSAALGGLGRSATSAGLSADSAKRHLAAFSKVAELREAVAGAHRMEQETRAAMAAAGDSADAAKRHFDALGKLQGLRRSLAEASRFERAMCGSMGGAGRAAVGMQRPLHQAGQSFSGMSRQAVAALSATQNKLDEAGKHVVAFEKLAELRRAEDGFKRVSRAAQGVGGSIGDASRKTTGLRENLRGLADATIALGGLKAAFEGVARIGAVPIKKFLDYDEALGELESKLAKRGAKPGETRNTAEFRALEAQIKEVGAKTKFTQTDIALTQANFAATGFTPAQILAATPVAANLATAASSPNEDVSPDKTAAILASTLAQFELGAESAQRVSDVLIAGADASLTSVTELSAQLKYVGAMAHRLKLSPEQTVTNLAILSNKGQSGTTAGTNMEAMLERLIAPNDTARAGLASIGIGGAGVKEIQDLAATGKLPEIMEKLARATGPGRTYSPKEIEAAKTSTRDEWEKKTKKSGQHYSEKEIALRVNQVEAGMKAPFDQAQVNEALKHIFETQGSNAADALSTYFKKDKDGVTDYDRLVKTVTESKDLTSEKAAIKEATAKGQADALSGSLESLVTNFGSKFAPEIERVTKLLGGLANSLNAIVDKFPSASKAVGVGTLAAGTAVGAVAALKGYAAVAAKVLGSGAAAGAAPAAAGTAAPAAAAGVGSIALPATAIVAALGGGYVAQQTGADKKVYEFFAGGGFTNVVRDAYKSVGVGGDLAADAAAYTVGPIANAVAKSALVVPAIGALAGYVKDAIVGKSQDAPATALSSPAPGTPGARVGESAPPVSVRVESSSPSPTVKLAPPTEQQPALLARPTATPTAGTSGASTPPSESPTQAPASSTDTAKLEALQREQIALQRDLLDRQREADRAAERRHQQALQAQQQRTRRGGGPQTGGVLETF